jgi:hypothetical protein
MPPLETFFAIFFLISLAENFCKAGEITTKLPHEIRSRKSPKINPPSTTLPKNTNKTQKKSPTKYQTITKNHQQSPKITINHKKSTTKTKNHKLSDQRTQRKKKTKNKTKPQKSPEKHPIGFTGVGP